MPDVPNVPGVPALTSFSANPVLSLATQVISLILGNGGPQWDIQLDGDSVFSFDSMNAIEFKGEWVIADYPTEPNAFVSYDKVQRPAYILVRIISGSDEVAREALLSEVKAAAGDTNLYDIITPEQSYSSYNIEKWSFRRTADDGVGMIKIDLLFKQIIVAAAANFSNTATPGVAGQTGTGNVQAQTPNQIVNADFSQLPSMVQ